MWKGGGKMGVINIQPAQSVTVKQEFECVYFYESDDGDIDINAHRYRVEVSVRKVGSVYNKIIEFSELQDILRSVVPNNKYLYSDDPDTTQYIVGQLLKTKCSSDNTLKLDFDLCAENICNWIATNLQYELDAQYSHLVDVTDVVLRENSQCFVSWHKVID